MKLLYKDVAIGRLDEVFESDGTWFGTLIDSDADASSDVALRARQFIQFCESWNDSQASEVPRTADEFDAFCDVIGDGLWQVDDGYKRHSIKQAPNFLSEKEVSWTTETAGK